ncbi:uncharacterized protein LOC142354414 [Convolutriloba macropyga]|uniref:uncharacterized protein LOC142354414 n=1 Tax=Convolutriloba macropyga TaxID=536237 RepID=UPI003F51AEA4
MKERLNICVLVVFLSKYGNVRAQKCFVPSINMQNSGSSWEFAVDKSIAEKSKFKASVSIDCRDSKAVTYYWSGRSESESAMTSYGYKNKPKYSRGRFKFSNEKYMMCLNVTFVLYPELTSEACGYYNYIIPDPVCEISGEVTESHDVMEMLVLDASGTYDPMDHSKTPSSMEPDPLTYEWFCSTDIERPSLSGFK